MLERHAERPRVAPQERRCESTNCALVFGRNTVEGSSAGALRADGGLLMIENNMFVQSVGINDEVAISAAASGSAVRFNTFVNTTSTPSDGAALYCDGTVTVTSNIFAYESARPMTGPGGMVCPSKYSLFDTVAVAAHTSDTGNKVAEGLDIFADRPAKDFRLAPESPAIGSAEPGVTVASDLAGNPRPRPQGGNADMGALEAP